jgi:hypothetical protein
LDFWTFFLDFWTFGRLDLWIFLDGFVGALRATPLRDEKMMLWKTYGLLGMLWIVFLLILMPCGHQDCVVIFDTSEKSLLPLTV